MRSRTATLAALLAAALALPACGGAGATVREPSSTINLTLDDYLIRPEDVRVKGGERLTVKVTNHGLLGHTLRVRAKTRNVLAITTIEPGETKTDTVRLARGTYTMYCVLANHEELGMYGKLVVG